MGLCLSDKGRISIEVRRESFTIHPDYGYETVDGVTVHSPPSDTFGQHWRDTPHPEFKLEELDDLISALEEVRQCLKERGR